MSEIKNAGETWMALNTFKCNYMTSLHFKWLKYSIILQSSRHGATKYENVFVKHVK